MNHERHIYLIAWFHIIVGFLSLMFVLSFFLLMGGTFVGTFGMIALNDPSVRGDAVPIVGIVSVFFAIFTCFLTLSAVPDLIVGWGLLKRKTWARYLAIVLSAIWLFNFPVGTILGAYTIWALWSGDANPYFERRYLVDYEYARS